MMTKEREQEYLDIVPLIVNQLSLDEKLSLLSGASIWSLSSGCVSRRIRSNNLSSSSSQNIPSNNSEVETISTLPVLLSDGPHGLRKTLTDKSVVESNPATCFPTGTTLACSWNSSLVRRVGRALATEARHHNVSVLLGPAMNIQRHPCGGRSFEYFSEDPLVTGRLASAMVHGIQTLPSAAEMIRKAKTDTGEDEDGDNDNCNKTAGNTISSGVGACLKHVCVNNQESRRFVVDVVVDERTLHEIYLRGFEYAVRDAQPWSMMCAYNKLNGTYCSDHKWLFQTVVREQWGFQGLVLTDWGATNDRVTGIKAGIDLEMPGSYGVHRRQIREALKRQQKLQQQQPTDVSKSGSNKDNNNDNNLLSMESLDLAVARNVELIIKARKGSGEEFYNPKYIGESKMLEEHHELAYLVALECAVLLKNENELLPLQKDVNVAVIGAFAKTPRFQGMGSSKVNPYKVDAFLDNISTHTKSVTFAPGYDAEDEGDILDEHLIQRAAETAQNASVAILMIGLPEICESEGFDRYDLILPPHHNALVEAICAVNKNTVVVLSNGGPVTMPWIHKPRSVMEGFLSGQAGGRALADLLFGVVSPSGKLAVTFPLQLEDVPADGNFPGSKSHVEYREGLNVGYRYFCSANAPVLFPFGHGLSYSKFDYRDLRVTIVQDEPENKFVKIQFHLVNSGSVSAAEVTQGYVHACDSTVYRPAFELKDFSKHLLAPGEVRLIRMTLTKESFSFYDVGVSDWVVEPGHYELRIGASCNDIRLTTRIELKTGHSASKRAQESHPPKLVMHPLVVDDERFQTMIGDNGPLRGKDIIDADSFIHRNTLLQDVKEVSWIGYIFAWIVLMIMSTHLPDRNDPKLIRISRAMCDNLPLRATVLFSEGYLSFIFLDILISLMNGQYLFALRVLFRSLIKARIS